MNKRTVRLSQILFLVFVGAGLYLFFLYEQGCVVHLRTEAVNGNSLSGIVPHGSKIEVAYGYYQCHPIQRNDVVTYRYPGSSDPLLKSVKAMPGDTFLLLPSESGARLTINGVVARNSEGIPYAFDDSRERLLSLYVRDYHGVIPEDAYLLLGDLVSGTLDSTQFGLVDKASIIGKLKRIISFPDTNL